MAEIFTPWFPRGFSFSDFRPETFWEDEPKLEYFEQFCPTILAPSQTQNSLSHTGFTLNLFVECFFAFFANFEHYQNGILSNFTRCLAD